MKKVLALLAVILLTATNLHAGNGDLIVNGNLGVGTATPSTKLHVAGSGSVVSVGNFGTEMKLENAATVGDAGSGSGFASNGSGASIGAWSNPITFYAGNNGSTKLERMRITESGYVGIGTTTPENKLDVNGGINAQAFNSDNGNFIVGPVGGSARIWTRNTSPLAFLVNDGEVMRITDGNVGIGTMNIDPQSLLSQRLV